MIKLFMEFSREVVYEDSKPKTIINSEICEQLYKIRIILLVSII